MTRQERAEKRLQATAYHEAGHAVARWALGLNVRRVSIVPDAESYGCCAYGLGRRFRPDLANGRLMENLVHGHIVALLAGESAEYVLRGRHNGSGAGSDLHEAADLATYVASDEEEVEALLKWLRVKARNLVRGRWWAVEASYLRVHGFGGILTSVGISHQPHERGGWSNEDSSRR